MLILRLVAGLILTVSGFKQLWRVLGIIMPDPLPMSAVKWVHDYEDEIDWERAILALLVYALVLTAGFWLLYPTAHAWVSRIF